MPYTVSQAARPALSVIERAYEEQFVAAGFNMAIQEIWNAYDWHWSIGKLQPFALISNVQDYGAPLATIPADFDAIKKAYYWNLAQDTTRPVWEVNVIGDLGTSTMSQTPPRAICYIPAGMSASGSGAFRVFPRFASNLSCPYHQIDGEYKKRYSYQIGSTTYYFLRSGDASSVYLPFGDKYFNVAVQAMKWAFMSLSGHKDAGGVQMQGNTKGYYGQMGVMMAAVDQMATQEARMLGNPAIAPQSALVDDYWTTGSGFGGVF